MKFASELKSQLSLQSCRIFFQMATLKSKKKSAAFNTEGQDLQPMINLFRDANRPKINEGCVTRNWEEIECRKTEKVSLAFTRTGSGTLGAVSNL